MAKQYWLMKSEPEKFGIDDLARVGVEPWDGIRNYQVRNMIRDQMQVGDLAFFYHSNCKVPSIVGTMEIVTTAYPDSSAWDVNHDYYDPKSSPEEPRWYRVDVRFVSRFAQPISLQQLRHYQATTLKNLMLLHKGNRLSIVPLSLEEWQFILSLQTDTKTSN